MMKRWMHETKLQFEGLRFVAIGIKSNLLYYFIYVALSLVGIGPKTAVTINSILNPKPFKRPAASVFAFDSVTHPACFTHDGERLACARDRGVPQRNSVSRREHHCFGNAQLRGTGDANSHH